MRYGKKAVGASLLLMSGLVLGYSAVDPMKRMIERQRKRANVSKEDKSRLQNLSEKNIDKTLADSFPASDPPANY